MWKHISAKLWLQTGHPHFILNLEPSLLGRCSRVGPAFLLSALWQRQHECKGCAHFTHLVWPRDHFIMTAVLWEREHQQPCGLHQVSPACSPISPRTACLSSPLLSPVSSQHHPDQYCAPVLSFVTTPWYHPWIHCALQPSIFSIFLVSKALSNYCLRQEGLVTSVSSLPNSLHLF